MISEIRRIMSEVLNVAVEEIGEDSSPSTVENWDSLKHMQLVIALEEELGIVFSDEQIPDLTSLDAIATLVRELSSDTD